MQGISTWEQKHCPWWLDFPKGGFPDEEAEEFDRVHRGDAAIEEEVNC